MTHLCEEERQKQKKNAPMMEKLLLSVNVWQFLIINFLTVSTRVRSNLWHNKSFIFDIIIALILTPIIFPTIWDFYTKQHHNAYYPHKLDHLSCLIFVLICKNIYYSTQAEWWKVIKKKIQWKKNGIEKKSTEIFINIILFRLTDLFFVPDTRHSRSN